jgi:HD-GYP domain-containing protein (c-di-GMP phosphodiesterase class II)
MSTKYLPIRIKTLKSDVSLGFELFLQLPHKYVLYINPEDTVNQERLDSLKDKSVRKVYIKDTDEPLYQNFMDKALDHLMNKKEVDVKEKAQMIGDYTEDACEQIFADPNSKRSYQKAQDTTKKLAGYLLENDKLLKNMLDRPPEEGDEAIEAIMYRHSVNSASLTIGFCDFFGLDSETIELMGLAAIYHDIGFTQFTGGDQELFLKSVKDMTKDEMKIYQEHPKVACEIIQDKDFVTKEFLELIHMHEERSNGSGFPQGAKKFSYEQEVLNLCVHFDREVTCLNRNPSDVLKELEENLDKLFTKELLSKFLKFMS